MTEKLKLYKCNVCGNVVEVVIGGAGVLVCCGKDMEELIPNTKDGAAEKHVPEVENLGTSHVVKVGVMPHPMINEHYIQFVEIISNDKRYLKRKYLNPDEEPEMVVKCLDSSDFEAREYCNIHGLYSNKKGENDGQ